MPKREGIITPGKTLSPFWYRRICEITLMVSAIIVALYFVGYFVLDIKNTGNAFFVPPFALAAAGCTALLSLAAYIFAKGDKSYMGGLAAYIALSITVGLLITGSGGTNSPFIALWLLIGVFSGLFGKQILFAYWTGASVYAAYELFLSGSHFTPDRIIALVLVAEAPMIASYIIWHPRTRQENGKDSQAFTALAKQLSQVSNKSDVVINSIADGVVAIDGNGIIQLINPAGQDLLGWPQQDALGLDYKSVIKLNDPTGKPLPEDLTPIRQVMFTNRSVTNNNLILTTKSGKKIMISLVVSPAGDIANQGVIAVFRDITREKEEERQKAEFISTASHEMRTPVAAIEGYLGLALNPATASIDEKARMYLMKAHESTQHLGRLFQDLLTVSKAEDSRLIPRPTPIDVVSFAREITDALQQKAKDKNIFLYYKPGEDDGDGNKRIMPVFYTYVDQDHFREVLSNLVENALKYTKQGSVTVDVTGTNETVTVNVTDTGIGIPPEDVKHLFQKFYRVDNTDTREIGGTGLGLYISRRLIEANSGRIGVNSTYGKGSTFFVEVPRITHEKATELITASATQSQAPSTPPKF